MSNKKNKTNTPRKHTRLSTELVLKYLSQRTEPANTKAIAETLGRVGKEGRQETFEILETLRDQGKVTQLSKHRWAQKHAIQEHRGRVVGHVDGHGFVITDETHEKVFLRAQDMREVLHNDIVNVQVTGRDRRKKLIGQITNIVERGNLEVVGRYFVESNMHFVVPDDQRINQDIAISPEHTKGAESGQVVSVKITKYPTKNFQPLGEVIEVLGDYLAPGMEIEIAIRKHQLPHEWPDAVERQIKGLSAEVTEKDFKGRKDIRDLPLVTIDGEDARDFDDAVYCQPLKNGRNRLIVAIADVSSYGTEQSPLDQEAWNRGTSVYFPNNVIPMLPEVLSNGLCSLNPEVNRLCFVCDMEVDQNGEIETYDFYQAVMYSHARLTYTQVAALIAGDNADSGIDEKLQPAIHDLSALSQKLGANRRQSGTIEFEIPEPVIVFDDERKIDRVEARERNDAHRLIEECMLSANVATARFLKKNKMHTLYRVHEGPGPEKLENLREFLGELGLQLQGERDKPKPADYQALLAEIKDRPDFSVIQTVMLRSLSQAVYSPEEEGHFGLGYPHYAHFTSPIRRYADLIVHRALITAHGWGDDGLSPWDIEHLTETAKLISDTERRSMTAERDTTDRYLAAFLSERVGNEFSGRISGIAKFGAFVKLDETGADGLIPVRTLGREYFHFDREAGTLMGSDTGFTIGIGQRVTVRLAQATPVTGGLELELLTVDDKSVANPVHLSTNRPCQYSF